MEDSGLFIAGFPADLKDRVIYVFQDICLEKGIQEVLTRLDVLIYVSEIKMGAHIAEIVLGNCIMYSRLILAIDVLLYSWIMLGCFLIHWSFLISHLFVFMLVELSEFFVCSDGAAVWVSILPQFVKVHFPI